MAARYGAPAITIRRTGDTAATIRTTTRTSPATDTPRGTTRERAGTDAVRPCMGRTAAPAWALATIREPGPTRAAPSRTVRAAPAASRRPTTHAPEPTPRRVRDPMSTAAGARPRSSAATTGRKPTATPTGRPARRRARSEPMTAAR